MEETKILNDSDRFIEYNQESFQELLSFIDFAEEDDFTLGFIEINFAPEIDILVERLRQHFPEEEEVQFEVFSFPDPGLRFLRDVLKEEIPRRNIDPNKKTVLIIRDLEYSIGVYGSYPPVLADLNYVRNAYKLYVPHPMLFVLPDFAITRVIRFAPDFWDWRSCFFRFKTTQETREFFEKNTLKFDGYIEGLSVCEKQKKIDNYHRLLMEYHPTGKLIEEEENQKYGVILYKLGEVYESQGNYEKARKYLEEALELATRTNNLNLKGKSISYFGLCDYRQGKFKEAIISNEQSLNIAREIEDFEQEARALNNLGNVYASQGEYSQAIKYYQQSLEIRREIGDRYGIASSLNNLGNVYQSQGEYSQALEYHQQSLEIKREIDDHYGIACSLGNLGIVYGYQGEYSQAIQYYQQSLEIQREIGDLDGIASSLSNLGVVYSRKKEYDKAIDMLKQARKIFQEINLYHKISKIDQFLQFLKK